MTQDKIIWKRISKSRFWEMLEVLWPAYWDTNGFLVGEPWDHNSEDGSPRFAAFKGAANGNGPFFEANRPMTVKEFKQNVEL